MSIHDYRKGDRVDIILPQAVYIERATVRGVPRAGQVVVERDGYPSSISVALEHTLPADCDYLTLFLMYRNDYLTLAGFADSLGVTEYVAERIIRQGQHEYKSAMRVTNSDLEVTQ